jgi:hypothetical protein
MSDQTLSNSTARAVIKTSIDRVDIWDWLRKLPEGEYQRCAPSEHIASGFTTTDDGRPMSINVEHIGDALVIQHYVGEVTEKHHCRMVSISDLFTPLGRTKIRVIWDLSVRAVDDQRCEFTNDVLVFTTPEFLAALEQHGITFEQAAPSNHAAIADHNSRETPLFAASIERKALCA